MLGDGIVSFGVAVVVIDASAVKSSPKMGRGSEMRSSMTSTGVSADSSPCSSRKWILRVSSPGWTPPSW
jgi:hypothetical protein